MSSAFGPSQTPPNRDAPHPDERQTSAPGVDHAERSAAPLAPTSTEAPGTMAPDAPRTIPEARRDAAESLPPLDDPYLVPPPSRLEQRPPMSTLAVGSVAALLFGPIGPVLAIFFGWAARREIERAPGRRRGYALATAGLMLGVLLTVGWGAGIAFGAWMWRAYRGAEIASTSREGETSPEPASTGSPAAPAQTAPPAGTAQPGRSVPQHTTSKHIGGVLLVDVGIDAPTLGEELAKQRAEASSRGEKMLVMTTSEPCEPCEGVQRSLGDPMMQTALRGVRIVRVDIDVFKDDLDQLKMPRRVYPSFFLLSPDLTPQDGINGGEWDDDIARNIAPVLGAFVRGQYATRRQQWQPLPGSGMRL